MTLLNFSALIFTLFKTLNNNGTSCRFISVRYTMSFKCEISSPAKLADRFIHQKNDHVPFWRKKENLFLPFKHKKQLARPVTFLKLFVFDFLIFKCCFVFSLFCFWLTRNYFNISTRIIIIITLLLINREQFNK